jgi:flavin reductase (DIM6/NTAB) family NADH-FMN oxidoreductase RutF
MSFDGIELRNAFGQFATGVTVVTAAPKGYAPFGMTANSFSSLSLDPPLLLWSIQRTSDLFEAFEIADQFAVNILAADQQDMSNAYAKKGAHELAEDHFVLGDSGCPILTRSVATFECAMENRFDGGDHVILVGRVQEVKTNPELEPLLFHAGKYRTLGALD